MKLHFLVGSKPCLLKLTEQLSDALLSPSLISLIQATSLPADNYARELIEEIDLFRCQCKPKLRHAAQHLIEKIRFSEITLAAAESAQAHLQDKNREEDAPR